MIILNVNETHFQQPINQYPMTIHPLSPTRKTGNKSAMSLAGLPHRGYSFVEFRIQNVICSVGATPPAKFYNSTILKILIQKYRQNHLPSLYLSILSTATLPPPPAKTTKLPPRPFRI